MPGRSAFIIAVTSLAFLPAFTPSRMRRATVSSISCEAFDISVTCSRAHVSSTFFTHGSCSWKASPMAIFLNASSSFLLKASSERAMFTMAPSAGPLVPGSGSRSARASSRGTIMGTAMAAYSFQRFCKKREIAEVYCRSRASGYFHFLTLSLRSFERVMPPDLFRSSMNLVVGIIDYAPCPPSPFSRLKSGGSSSSTLVSRA